MPRGRSAHPIVLSSEERLISPVSPALVPFHIDWFNVCRSYWPDQMFDGLESRAEALCGLLVSGSEDPAGAWSGCSASQRRR